jgi:hypothetical protein
MVLMSREVERDMIDRDVLLVLLGATISLVPGLVRETVSHYLSLGEDRVKRERDRADRERQTEQERAQREAEDRRRSLLGGGALEIADVLALLDNARGQLYTMYHSVSQAERPEEPTEQMAAREQPEDSLAE